MERREIVNSEKVQITSCFFLSNRAKGSAIGISRTAGRLAGRAIGYVQLGHGQFDSIMQQTQAREVHKELQDTIAQLEAIRHEIRSISAVNPGRLTSRLTDNPNLTVTCSGEAALPNVGAASTTSEVASLRLSNVHSQATDFAKLVESSTLQASMTGSVEKNEVDSAKLTDELGHFKVLLVSAENTGMLPKHSGDVLGSDILLNAVLEAEVALANKRIFLAAPKIKYTTNNEVALANKNSKPPKC